MPMLQPPIDATPVPPPNGGRRPTVVPAPAVAVTRIFGPPAPPDVHRAGQAAHPGRDRSRRRDRRYRRDPASRGALLLDAERLAPAARRRSLWRADSRPGAARKSPNPTRSPPKWRLLAEGQCPPDAAPRRAPKPSSSSKKKLRSCWASRWRRATTSLDRGGRGTRAGRRHDRRGLRRARGFARQRACAGALG